MRLHSILKSTAPSEAIANFLPSYMREISTSSFPRGSSHFIAFCSFHLCLNPCLNPTHILGTAYGKTLRRYHGWVVRGVFAVSVWFPFVLSFVTWFVRACVRAFARSFVHAFVPSLDRSFVYSFVPSYVRLSVRSFILVCSFVRSVVLTTDTL